MTKIAKFREMDLVDTSTDKEADVAEKSRPYRAFKEKERAKRKVKHPEGRKRQNEPRPANYVNWHTPFIWRQIDQAAKDVGPSMSPTEIVRLLKNRDRETFDKLKPSTVDGWIDKSGTKRRWKDSTLNQAERGNDPGHANGGKRGILVCPSLTKSSLASKLSGRGKPH